MNVAEQVSRIRAGDRRAIATLIRELDDERPAARETLRALGTRAADDGAAGGGAAVARPAMVVGITGGPGAGKSTLVDALVSYWRAAGERVGVVAIDPTSPVAGGAVLGDRIRMQRHATDEGVFIRSVASRGALGGLSRSALQVVTVLQAAGFSRVVVETVGAGQAEVDIAGGAEVTVVVLTPGLGDDIQMLKSGILEVADVLVLNKADRPGAEGALRDLHAMLALRQLTGAAATGTAPATEEPGGIQARGVVPVIPTVASSGQGVAALASAIDAAHAAAVAPGSGLLRRRAEARIRGIVTARLAHAARQALAPGGVAASLVDDVAALRMDAHDAADALMARLGGGY